MAAAPGFDDSAAAEAKAAWVGLNLAREIGAQRLILESD